MAYTQSTVSRIIQADDVKTFQLAWPSLEAQPSVVTWCLETIWEYNAAGIMLWLVRDSSMTTALNELLSRHTLETPQHLLLFHIIAANVRLNFELKAVLRTNTANASVHDTTRIIAHELVYLNDDVFAESLGQPQELWE